MKKLAEDLLTGVCYLLLGIFIIIAALHLGQHLAQS